MGVYNISTKKEFSLDDCLRGFFALRAETTQRHYKGVLSCWLEYLDRLTLTWPDAKEHDANLFLDEIAKRKGQHPRMLGSERVSKSTIKNYATILHAMAQYLMRHGVLERDIFAPAMDRFRAAREGDKRPTQMLAFEAVLKVINNISDLNSEDERNKTFLVILFGAGLRIGECLNLCLGDIIEATNGVLALRLRHTKAGHEQILPVSDWVKERILKYLERRKAETNEPNSPLLPNFRHNLPTNKPIPIRTAQRLFKKLLKDAGIIGNYSCHSARATFVSRLLEQGYDLHQVMGASRHQSPAMVNKYDKRLISLENNCSRKISYDSEKKD